MADIDMAVAHTPAFAAPPRRVARAPSRVSNAHGMVPATPAQTPAQAPPPAGINAEAWLRGRTPRTASAAVKRTHAEAGFTEARSPKLHTVERARARAVTTGPRTREERELEELRAIGQFKAHPLSRKIFEGVGEAGVPRLRKVPLTEPQGFAFHTDQRLATRRTATTDSQDTNTGRTPAKRRSLAPPPITEPVHKRSRLSEAATHVIPFRFETDRRSERIRQLQAEKEQEAKREAERRVQQAHSAATQYPGAPLPVPGARALPLAAVHFHNASNLPRTRLSLAPAPVSKAPVLHSEARSRQRAAWEAEVKAQQAEDERRRREEEQQAQERERAFLRARAIPYATPIVHYGGITVHPSQKPLTQPQSPRLMTKLRAVAPRE